MAVVYYDRLYRKKGSRRIEHFVKPRILNAKEFDFPVGSVFQWWKVSDNIEYVTKDYGYFSTLDRAQVETFYEYPEEAEGKFISKTFLINPYITESGRKCKDFKFLKPGQEIKVTDKVLKIANYGPISAKYKYTMQPMKDYYVHRNVFRTVISNMFKTGRRVFLLIDMPNVLPSRIELEKMSRKMTPGLLSKLVDYKQLNLLDIWKFITPELKNDSILNGIPANKYSDVDLLFTLDNKVILMNMKFLVGAIADYNTEFNGGKPKSFAMIKKMFYFMCNKLINSAAMSDSDLEKNETDIDKNQSGINGVIDKMENSKNDVDVKETDFQEVKEEPKQELSGDIKVKEDEPTEITNKIAGGALQVATGKSESIMSKLRNTTFNDENVASVTELDELLNDNDDETELELDKFSKQLLNTELVDRAAFESMLDTTEDDEESTLEVEENINALDKKIIKNEIILDADLDIKLEEVLNQEMDFVEGVSSRNDYLESNKIITKVVAKKNREILEKQKTMKDPLGSGKTLKEILDISKDKTTISKEKIKITPNKVVFDDTYNNNLVNVLKNDYIKDQYKKDMVRMIYSLQNAGYIIENYSVETKENILGGLEEHSITIRTLDGKSHTIKLNIPSIDEEGVIKMSGQSYVMRMQRQTAILAKIAPGEVKMSSYYSTYFIAKAAYKKDDAGYYFLSKLASLSNMEGSDIKDLVLTPSKVEEVKLPLDYAQISRYVKSFKKGKMVFSFDYEKRKNIFVGVDDETLKKVEGKNTVLIGSDNGTPIVMDYKNRLFKFENNKYTEIDDIYTITGIDRDAQPVEYSVIKIFKKVIPVGLLLSYYFGLNNLLKMLKVKYTAIDSNARITLEPNTYVIKFKDVKLIIERDSGIGDLIIAGLNAYKTIIKDINLDMFNKKDNFMVVFNKLDMALLYINEIKNLESLFLDPISLTLCKELGFPTNFKGLLIKANEMLVDDYYKNPNNISQMCIKGYERICGMVYNELCRAIREYDNKSMFTKAKIGINPFKIISNINEDSTTVLVDDLNPMAAMKQTEDVSYLGMFGINKDALARDSRIYNKSEVGIISEAVKDNGDVGITAYLSSAPKIGTIRGTTETSDKDVELSSVFSTNAMLTPFSVNDDSKRVNFSNIMSSHVIPINSMRAPYVRTGYEAIVGVRANNKFVISAEDDGTVVDVANKYIKVKYKSMGEKTYKIEDWTSKEETESCYTHIMKTSLKKGDKFIKDDTLVYDSMFFEPDVFNNKRVIYKQGDLITVALVEDQETYEDSGTISIKLNKRLGTVVTKVKSIVVERTDNIADIKQPGDKVEPNDTILTVTDSNLPTDKLDSQTLALLKDLKAVSPKAKLRGEISKIEIRYNCEFSELSDSLKKLVKISDANFKDRFGFTGRVNSSYSIEGKPLMEGQVQIKVYIKVDNDMGIGDKAILSNQLKFTVGEVFENTLQAEDGTDVECTFSYRSISARIVNSAMFNGTTSMVLEKLTEKVVDEYFK